MRISDWSSAVCSSDLTGDTATQTATIDLTVTAVADAPALTASDASGSEDTAIPLDIQAALTDTDGSEALSISITGLPDGARLRSEEHTSELQSLMRISYAVFCLKKKTSTAIYIQHTTYHRQ